MAIFNSYVSLSEGILDNIYFPIKPVFFSGCRCLMIRGDPESQGSPTNPKSDTSG